jgi:hypothetical protein
MAPAGREGCSIVVLCGPRVIREREPEFLDEAGRSMRPRGAGRARAEVRGEQTHAHGVEERGLVQPVILRRVARLRELRIAGGGIHPRVLPAGTWHMRRRIQPSGDESIDERGLAGRYERAGRRSRCAIACRTASQPWAVIAVVVIAVGAEPDLG